MKYIKPDIQARIYFYPLDKGGLIRNPVTADFINCPLVFNKEAFECRLLLKQSDNNNPLFPGETREIPIKFLMPENIKDRLHIGDKITLWYGSTFAEGEVTAIF